MVKYLSSFLIILSECSYGKEHPKNISQIWLNKNTPGYFRLCGPGNYGESKLILLNKSDSFYQTDIDKLGARYFYNPGDYDFKFKCELKTFEDGKQKAHYIEIIEHRIKLKGGKLYDVQLKLKNREKFEGCDVKFFDKYTKKLYPSLLISSKKQKHIEK